VKKEIASGTQPKLLILGQVIQRYYVQYLAGYDAVALAQMIQTTSVTSEEDNVILSSICTQISQLSLDNVEVIHCLITGRYINDKELQYQLPYCTFPSFLYLWVF
jgi:hypothetical protein